MHELPLPEPEDHRPLDERYDDVTTAVGPDRIHALVSLGEAMLDDGDDDGAFAAFAAALDTADDEVCPHHPPLAEILADLPALEGSERADCLWELGVRARTWGLDDLALGAFRAAGALYEECNGVEEHAWCVQAEASLLAKRGDLTDAAARYRDAAWRFRLTDEPHEAGDAWSAAANLSEDAGDDALDVLVDLAHAEEAYLAVEDPTCAASVRAWQARHLLDFGATAAAAAMLQAARPLLADDERPYVDITRARALSELRLFEDAADAATAAIEGLHELGEKELEGKVRHMRRVFQRRADQDRRRAGEPSRTGLSGMDGQS